MMREDFFNEEREELDELLHEYENLRTGKSHSFLEEDAFEQIIDYFDDRDDLAKATEATELALEYYPYSADLLIKKADFLIAGRKYHEALDVLDKANGLGTSNIGLYILRTDAYLALDEQETAARLLEEALCSFEGEERIDLLFELADVYDDYEEFDKVFDCLKMILNDDPSNEEALYKICFWTDFTGRFEESIHLHQEAIDKVPYCELAWFNLGSAYYGIKLYEKAIDAYMYAITINEKFDYAYRNMGDAYIRMRKYKEAIDTLQKLLEFTRPEEILYEAIGYCYHKIKNFAQARFHFRKASHLSPGDSKLYHKIALTYMDEMQWEPAIRTLDTALKLNKNAPEFNLAMGECKMKVNNFNEAIRYFSNAVSLRPKNAACWEALIRSMYVAGYYDEAIEQVYHAIANTGSPVFVFYHSLLLFALNKKKEGLMQLERGMQMSPKLLKKVIDLNPALLQITKVVDIIARYKKVKKEKG
ncbi:MAG: tetratricopeptide repeat protein [Chitinophagaceae bacterium]|jgi:tetratricopeptide (TPR) repeat protein|nr:tetratricopeptide repeat protein [Chitinophagaceae bacterium]